MPTLPNNLYRSWTRTGIASFVAGLNEFGDEQLAIVGSGNALREIMGLC